MNICVVGTGYVGLVAGTCLADFGMNVHCVDRDESKIKMLKNGKAPIYEIGLNDMIQRNTKLGRLHFMTDLDSALERSLVVFLAVGTPQGDDGQADLSQVFEVGRQIAKRMKDYKVIVTKSTVPVGTAAKLREIIKENQPEPVEFDIVSNPEFLREGSAVEDFLHPDRVVIGSDSERALAIIKDVYRPLALTETTLICTNNATAELIKYAANTMLAIKVSYVNEIANLCECIGADIAHVAAAVGLDKRIGPHFLQPGPGYGGSCLPKDVSAIVEVGRNLGYEFMLARSAMEVNTRQKKIAADKAREMLGGSFKNKTICLLGLAFKANTDDCRESPAMVMAETMLAEGAKVQAYDPVAMEEAAKDIENIDYCSDSYEAAKDADIIVIATEWHEFLHLELDRIKKIVKQPNLFDSRNIFEPKTVIAAGFKYLGTGRTIKE